MDPDIGRKVSKYVRHAVEDMLHYGRDEISCPCSKCKDRVSFDPFQGSVKSHLLRSGFMSGFTRWISAEDDEVTPSDEEGGNNNDEEPEDEGNEAPGWDQDDGDMMKRSDMKKRRTRRTHYRRSWLEWCMTLMFKICFRRTRQTKELLLYR
jgi:hypothetical protein